MKATIIFAFLAICASAQPVSETDVPRLLVDRGIKPATKFAAAYQAFQEAVRAMPTATAEMKGALTCAKRRSVTIACDDGIRNAAKKFQAARYRLRSSHREADESMRATLLEIVARSLAMNRGKFTLLPQEDVAVERYFKEAARCLGRNFAVAEKQWRKTWQRAEPIIDRRRKINDRRARQEGARLIHIRRVKGSIPISLPETFRGRLCLSVPAWRCRGHGQ